MASFFLTDFFLLVNVIAECLLLVFDSYIYWYLLVFYFLLLVSFLNIYFLFLIAYFLYTILFCF